MNARLRNAVIPRGAMARVVQRRALHGSREVEDSIACEVPIALHYNDAPFAVLMATPCDLEDLALGFTVSEGLVEGADEVQVDAVDEELEGFAVRMSIPQSCADALFQRQRNLPAYGGCGVCGSATLEAVLRTPARIANDLQFEERALYRALGQLHERQPLGAATGATHAAAFADVEGAVQVVREDVGRHNALDKLIGAMCSRGIAAQGGFAITTSRASFELAMKAAHVGIPLLAAISAPTTLAIALADSAALCLVGFARDRACVVYAHPQRLVRGA